MIHLFKRAGLNIALDVASGSVHLLDETAYALLRTLDEAEIKTGHVVKALASLQEQYGESEIRDSLRELTALAQNGQLYTEDDYSAFQTALGVAPIKAMCLHISHDCNLRCRYCFAQTGDFGGARELMDLDTAKRAIDFLIAHSEARHNLEVDFFGGEPLMNFGVVRQTVEYAHSLEEEHNKHFRFTITTNGLALDDDSIEFINSNMDNVVLSLDGRKEINDAMRPTVGGKGSFDAIVPKMQALVAGRQGKEYYVRGTYTRHNLDFFKDVLAINLLGFNQISVEPAVITQECEEAILEDDVPRIEESYNRLLEEMKERSRGNKSPFNFFHFMLDLDNGPCAIKRLKGCGSGNEYVAITPRGEIYPCHQFVGNPAFLMGDVYEGQVDAAIKEKFAGANLLSKEQCQDCWAKYHCSGGCNANNYGFEGSILEPHGLSCELEKIRLECAITLKAFQYLINS